MHQAGENKAIKQSIVNALHDRVVLVEFSARNLLCADLRQVVRRVHRYIVNPISAPRLFLWLGCSGR
jgi:hypothetical protein